MKCPKDEQEYYEAFYGTVPQDHIYVKVRESFEKMAKKFKEDILEKFPNVEDLKLGKAMICGLQVMGEMSEMPGAYFSRVRTATTGIKAALAEINRLRKQEANIERAAGYTLISDSDFQEMHDENMGTTANFMVELERHIQNAIASGEENRDAKITGFCNLLKQHKNPEGYAYYLLGMKIPVEIGIWDTEKVIEAMNAHPVFQRLKRAGSFKGPYNNGFIDPIK